MRCTMRMTGGRHLVGGLALGAAVLGSAGVAVGAARAATPAATPTWVTTQGKVVHLTLIAGWNDGNAGFNFDGAANGQMTVTVPPMRPTCAATTHGAA